jgi:hypothetical protein
MAAALTLQPAPNMIKQFLCVIWYLAPNDDAIEQGDKLAY